jgi:hypothetical protein
MQRMFFLICCLLLFVYGNSGGAPDHPVPCEEDMKARTDGLFQGTPKDPFPVEKTFRIMSVNDSILAFKKNDLIKISTKNGLKHYRNNRLLNTYKIIPQLSTIMIQPKCNLAPCPEIEWKVLVYYLDFAKCFIDIRNNVFRMSAETYEAADTPAKDIRLSWKNGYDLSAKK